MKNTKNCWNNLEVENTFASKYEMMGDSADFLKILKKLKMRKKYEKMVT